MEAKVLYISNRWLARSAIAVAIHAIALISACGDYSSSYTAPNPGFVLSTPSPALSLTQGNHASLDVTIERSYGFAEPVTLAISGAPANVDVQVDANPVSGSRATLTITVGESVAPGTFRLTITGSGAGVQASAIPLDVTVSARALSTVDVAYCEGLAPVWVAFQDGDGAFTQAQPMVSSGTTTFRHTFSTNRGAVATTTLVGRVTVLAIQYAAPAELSIAGNAAPQFCGPAVSKTLRGIVAGLDTNEFAAVSAGSLREIVNPFSDGEFKLDGLPAGPLSILATKTTRVADAAAVTRMILRRIPDLPDGAMLPVLDFNSPDAFAPAVASVTIAGLGAEGALSATRLVTQNGQSLVSLVTNGMRLATRPYVAVPESRLEPTDLQALLVTAGPNAQGTARATTVYFRSPVEQTVALGAPPVAPSFSTLSTTPALRFRVPLARQDDYERAASVSFQQGAGKIVIVSMTAAYAALTGTGFDLTIPDLSSVPGFDAAWALAPGGDLAWGVSRIGGTLGLGVTAVPTNGATQRTAFIGGTIAAR